MNRIDQKRDRLRTIFAEAAREFRLHRLTVSEVMTQSPVTVRSNQTAEELFHLFQEKKFRHFLVVEAGTLVGVISDRDVIRQFGMGDFDDQNYLASVTAGDLMSLNPLTVTPQESLSHAASLLIDNGISCLPVVAAGEPVGIVTLTDLSLALEQTLATTAAYAPLPRY